MTCEPLIKRAKATFNEAEVYRFDSESFPVHFESNKLKAISRKGTSGVALRGVKDGRIGLSASTDPSRENELIDRVLEISKFGSTASFNFPEDCNHTEVNIYDDQLLTTTSNELITIGENFIDKVLQLSPQLVCDSGVGWSKGTKKIFNTTGLSKRYSYTQFYFYLAAKLIKESDMLNIFVGYSSHTKANKEDLIQIFNRFKRSLNWSSNVSSPPVSVGEIPVIFMPSGFLQTFMNPLLSGFNGKNLANGSSPISGDWGKKKLHEDLTIQDNPHLLNGRGTRPFDDEGVPTRMINLVQNGILVEPFYDLQTAGQTGNNSSGSAFRSLGSHPYPSTSNIDIAPGSAKVTEIISNTKDGLIVEELLGAGQGNELSGDFKANVSLGYRIQNGEITGRVKDTVISGNAYKCLSQIEFISDDSEWVFGSGRVPTISCTGVEISAGQL